MRSRWFVLSARSASPKDFFSYDTARVQRYYKFGRVYYTVTPSDPLSQTNDCSTRLLYDYPRSLLMDFVWFPSGSRRSSVPRCLAARSSAEADADPRLDIISMSHPIEFPNNNNNNCYYNFIVVIIIIPVLERRSCYDLSPPRITSAINKIKTIALHWCMPFPTSTTVNPPRLHVII